jgi:hypothetical protein
MLLKSKTYHLEKFVNILSLISLRSESIIIFEYNVAYTIVVIVACIPNSANVCWTPLREKCFIVKKVTWRILRVSFSNQSQKKRKWNSWEDRCWETDLQTRPLETMFTLQFVTRLYNEDQQLLQSKDVAVRRVEGSVRWPQVKRGRESGSRETSLSQNINICVTVISKL